MKRKLKSNIEYVGNIVGFYIKIIYDIINGGNLLKCKHAKRIKHTI